MGDDSTVDDGDDTSSSIFDFSQYFESFTDWFADIGDSLSSLLDLFNPASDEFFLKQAFVPDEGYFQGKYDEFKVSLATTLGYGDYISFLTDLQGMSSSRGSYVKTMNIYGVGSVTAPVIDTSFYDAHTTWIFSVIRGVLAIFCVLFNINQIYKLLNRGATIVSIGVGTGVLEKQEKSGAKK